MTFFVLILAMIVMAFLDLAGVAAILPFLAVLSNPGTIERSGALSALYGAFDFDNELEFLRFLGFLVFAIVIVSIIVRAVTFYFITRFNRDTVQYLALSLLERYLARPYEWYLDRNSAAVGKSILAEANHVVNFAIAPAIRMIANGLVAATLVLFLIYLEPVGATMTAAVLSGAFALIYWRAGRWLSRAGKDRLKASEERFQITQEAMTGIKEIKLRGLEASYAARFRDPSDRLARHQATIHLIGDIPHFFMEAICFGGMLIFVLYLLYSGGGSINTVLPVIGAFAFAGLKLMPLIQGLFRDVASLRGNIASIDSIHVDMNLLPPLRSVEGGDRLLLRNTLKLDNISYRYPGAEQNVLSDLNLTIKGRSSVGFVGATGAGKTTVIDIILGLLTPQSGAVVVDGVPITDANRRSWQQSIGYVPQFVHLADDTIAANIAFGVAPADIDQAKVERAARIACLHDFVNGLEEKYQTTAGEAGVRLSGGQRQRIGIARALFHDPDLIFFDEATSSLDTVTERAVMDAMLALQGQKTMIVVTHRLMTVRHCDTIFVLENGKIVSSGSFEELSGESARFQELLAAM